MLGEVGLVRDVANVNVERYSLGSWRWVLEAEVVYPTFSGLELELVPRRALKSVHQMTVGRRGLRTITIHKHHIAIAYFNNIDLKSLLKGSNGERELQWIQFQDGQSSRRCRGPSPRNSQKRRRPRAKRSPIRIPYRSDWLIGQTHARLCSPGTPVLARRSWKPGTSSFYPFQIHLFFGSVRKMHGLNHWVRKYHGSISGIERFKQLLPPLYNYKLALSARNRKLAFLLN